MTLLAFAFTKITVADLDAAERFYRDAIGLKTIKRITADGGEWGQEECIMSVSGRTDGPMLLLIRLLHKPCPPPGEAWTGFAVSDLAAAAAAIEKAGGKVVVAPHDAPAFKLAAGVFTDPEGHIIEVTQSLA